MVMLFWGSKRRRPLQHKYVHRSLEQWLYQAQAEDFVIWNE